MSTLALSRPRPLAMRWPSLGARLPAILAVTAAAAACLRPALDADLGWHLRAGQLILATHRISPVDPFSHTRLGAPWVDNEWLWETGLALIHAAGGLLALVAFNAALTALAVGLVYMTLQQRQLSPLLASAGALLALVNLVLYSDVRPGMVGVAGSAAFVLLLEKHRQSGNRRWLLALLPVEALWANGHGSYVLGLAIAGIYAAGALWESRRWQILAGWALLGFGLLAVTLLNPKGVGLLQFTIGASRLSFNREFVQAWMAPDFHDLSCLPLLMTVMLSLALPLLCTGCRLPKTESLLLLACTMASLQSKEFFPLYAVAAAPLLAQMGQAVLRTPRDWRPTTVQNAASLFAIVVLAILPAQRLAASSYAQAVLKAFPVRAVEFIEQQQLQGPMWNDFDWGGYLLTALPRLPVSVDSRTEMYGAEFLHEYLTVDVGRAAAQPVLDKYGIRLVLIRSGSRLAEGLGRNDAWQPTYDDGLAAVFVRA